MLVMDQYLLVDRNLFLFRKNITLPFEDSTSLEFFSKKTVCSLFLFGSHNKKRPNNLIFGRLFDFHILDMIELGIKTFVSLSEIKEKLLNPTTSTNGEKSLLIDFLRPTMPAVRLAGLEHVLHFNDIEGKISLHSYRCLLKKSGCRTLRIELEEVGPSLDLILRRTHLASDDLCKLAHKDPKAPKPKKKNISHDAVGTRFGRVHMQKQDLSKL